MCVVSMIVDHYGTQWNEPNRWMIPLPDPEIAVLRQEVENMKELLRKAKLYDIEHAQPDCGGKVDKVELVKQVAELVGVDLEDLL